ncbi:MAG: glycosyltransferase [Pseudomonadota bacterium]|nr:glycosyltransferase [Pseudomonadota bacterium]
MRDLAIAQRRRGHDVAIAFITTATDFGHSAEFETRFQQDLMAGSVATFEIGRHARHFPPYGGWRLSRIVRESRADVLHVHLQTALLFRLAARPFLPRRMAVVYTHHTSNLRLGNRIFRLLARSIDGVVAISNQTRELLSAQVKVPVALIPNSVAREVNAERTGPESDGTFRIISVGRLFPEKDYPTLVETAAAVFRARPELAGRLSFSIAGGGPERERIEALIAERGLERSIHLLGTRTDAYELMKQADLLLMTSSHEGLSMTLLEALHAKLPIVSTDVGGCSEVVRHGENGLLAPSGDAGQLAAHILRILDDPALAKRFQEASGRLAADYNMDGSVERHLDFYAQLLRAKGQR